MLLEVIVERQFTNVMFPRRLFRVGEVEKFEADLAVKLANAGLVRLNDLAARLELSPDKPSIKEILEQEVPGLKVDELVLSTDELHEIHARFSEQRANLSRMSDQEFQFWMLDQIEEENQRRIDQLAEIKFTQEQIEEAHLQELGEKGKL